MTKRTTTEPKSKPTRNGSPFMVAVRWSDEDRAYVATLRREGPYRHWHISGHGKTQAAALRCFIKHFIEAHDRGPS